MYHRDTSKIEVFASFFSLTMADIVFQHDCSIYYTGGVRETILWLKMLKCDICHGHVTQGGGCFKTD
jgi:hypothetical protein